MSEAREALQRALQARAAEDRGPHPEPEELAAYRAGELSPEAERRVQDHLVACPECAGLLLDLDGLADPQFGAGAPQAAADLETAWESLRAQIAAQGPETGPAAAPVVVHGAFRRGRGPRWLYALAATLLLAVGLLSFQVASLSRQVDRLSQPEVNAPVVDLSQGTPRGDRSPRPAAVPAEARVFTLILAPAAHAPYATYAVEIADERGRPVYRGEGFQPNAYGSFSLTLTRRTLGPGDYRVRLLGGDGSRRTAIEEYALHVAPP